MKLTTSLILNNQSNQCQFAIEVNLDDDAEMDAYVEEVIPQLRRAGYTRSQIDQIVNDLYAGRTLDYAMQRFN